MKDKIFSLLKQAYKSLGLGDDVLMAHAEMLSSTGFVTEDNVENVVNAQKSFLESLQRENDRRVTDARKKFQDEQNEKEATEKRKREEAEALAKKEAERKAAEEEERKKLEELAKQNEIPEYFKKFMAEQAEKEKAAQEAALKAQEEYKQFLETLTKTNSEKENSYTEQLSKQNELIKDLQATIKKQQDEALAEKAAKAKADHQAKILSKAKELGIPQSRIEEGFVIADDADDETINNILTKVSNNYKTLTQPVFQGYRQQSLGEASKEEVDNIADSLIKKL